MNPVSKFTPKVRREKTYVSSASDNSDKKNSVQVFCRLRPLKDDEESTCIKLLSPTVLVLSTPAESRVMRRELQCHFKHIFSAYSSQKEVFEHVAYPLLEDLLHGKSGLLFTYGVTGSGKTHTLTGNHKEPGIMPKCIHTIFNTISEYQAPKFVIKSDKMNGFEVQSDDDVMQDKMTELRSATRTPRGNRRAPRDRIYVNDGAIIHDINTHNVYSVFVTYIEIYNNTVYDLLDETSSKLQAKILREDAQKNMYVNGVIEVEVKSAEEAFEMFNAGQKRKRMGNTILNSESSRSHSIFTIRVVQLQQVCHNSEGQPAVPDTNRLVVAQLSLVDLAGSERTNRTQNTGKLLKEASQINNSLMSLRSCLDTLRENQLTGSKKLVPYRDSRLTLLFKNHFEGDGNVRMIVCVNPSVADFEENLQVMKFAEMTQDVKVKPATPRYQTPIKKTISRKVATPVSRTKVGSGTSFSLGPKIPNIKLNFNNPQECSLAMERLIAALKPRCQKVINLNGELTLKETAFRKRLIGMHQENLLSKSELKSTGMQLKKEKQKSCNLETKLNDMDAAKNDLAAKNEELHNIIRSLHSTINEKDLKINKNILEKEKTKQKLALTKEKMTHELDAKLRRQRDHLEADNKVNKTKIQKVIELLNKDGVVMESDMVPEREERQPLQHLQPQQTPQRVTRRNNQQITQNTARRRSRSAGEVWLEHNSIKPVALGTVLQPSMKKRKSVTKLSKASDVTNPKQSKYCLIAQEQDKEGEMETKLYKADIVPTCGGGAQVIFNDVERLRQQSPTRESK